MAPGSHSNASKAAELAEAWRWDKALQALKKCEEMEPAPPQPQTPMQQPPSLARPATLKAVLEKEGAQALTWGSQRDAAMRRRSCEGASAHEAANGAAAASPAGPCPHRSHHRAAPPPAPSAATGAVQRVVSELNAPAKDSSKSKGFHSKLLGQLQSLVQPSGGKHAKNDSIIEVDLEDKQALGEEEEEQGEQEAAASKTATADGGAPCAPPGLARHSLSRQSPSLLGLMRTSLTSRRKSQEQKLAELRASMASVPVKMYVRLTEGQGDKDKQLTSGSGLPAAPVSAEMSCARTNSLGAQGAGTRDAQEHQPNIASLSARLHSASNPGL